MTIVCAQRVGNSVWIGSDSLACSGNFKYPAAELKWHKFDTFDGAMNRRTWWVGFTGTDRLYYLVRQVPAWPSTVSAWCDMLHRLAIDDGWHDGQKDSGPKQLGDNLIIVSPDLRVYEVGSMFTPSDYDEEFCALGSGESYAYGAAHAFPTMDGGMRMRAAVEAACKYSLTCAPPIFVKEITNVQA